LSFKDVNDRLGHSAGDELLRSVAALLRTSLRPSDALARLGGDEFALLLPESGPEEAAATLERLRLLLIDNLASSQPPVTATFGAVTFMTAPDTVEEMVKAADSRMYAAKSAGRNRVHLEVVPGAGDMRRVSPAASR
jgi:diguanylate cyclase (GGDEF)-like protein